MTPAWWEGFGWGGVFVFGMLLARAIEWIFGWQHSVSETLDMAFYTLMGSMMGWWNRYRHDKRWIVDLARELISAKSENVT